MRTSRLGALLIASLFPAVSAAAIWSVAPVEPTLNSTEAYALRLNAAGTPHIAMGGSTSVLYGFWDGQGFELESVYPPPIASPAGPAAPQLLLDTVVDIAVGTDGEPRIAHTLLNGVGPVPSGTLKLSTRNHGVWSVESLLRDSRGRPSLDIDGNGREHIAFMPNSAGIQYAVRSGAGWNYETVTLDGRDPMLRLGHDGVPYVTYVGYDPPSVRLAVRAGGVWSSTIVALESAGEGPALAIQPDGTPAIAYVDASGTQIEFAEFDGTVWVVTPVASGGPFAFRPSLACDYAGPHVAYRDNPSQSLVVADRVGGTWSSTTVDTAGNTGLAADMTSDPFGRAWILYGSADSPDAWYARRVPTVEAPVLSPPAGIALRLSGANPIAAGVAPVFQLELPAAADVTLSLWDVSGRRVAERRAGPLDAGPNVVTFGVALRTPGLYFVRATTGDGASVSTRLVVTAAGK